MKRFLKTVAALAALAFSFEIGKLVLPVPSARAAIALSDEVSVQRVFINIVDAPARSAPMPLSLHGKGLNEVQQNLRIVDAKGIYCFCKGDFRLSFKRFGLTLASFTGHLSESPARLASSQPLNIEPQGARRLSAFLERIAPR